ncbi:MAG: helix-turn-helix domain-containing protein [Fischerella sp.]|uniref:sigma factor-like helix-turn-helix DNA-binding protein n=1 Tax=Fischerella sp. TaxID=1191 RepID=UPI00184F797F|nr:helix-turn-helix domain-containing protein [Fischerella sp.]
MKRLTEQEKQNILQLYRETNETTTTLASKYNVTESTISRLLKNSLPMQEYEHLIRLKRAAR